VQTAIEGIITELRQIGVPVSLAERIDAVQSLEYLPLAERATVKSALRSALIKNHDHELAFDALFDLYFTPPVLGAMSQDEQYSDDGQDDGGSGGGGGGAGGAGGGSGSGAGSVGSGALNSLDDAALTDLLLAAFRDDNEVMMRTIAGVFVDRHANVEPGRPVAGTYYVLRTMRAVNPDRLVARLAEERAQAAGNQPGSATDGLIARLNEDRREAQLTRFRQAVEAEVRRRLVEDRGAEAVAKTLRQPLPEDADFLTSSRDQITAMRATVDPLARKLASRLSAKRRHHRRGPLDFRRTIRKSLSTGGVPVYPKYAKPKPSKPELFVVADISGSVSTFAAFTLQLVFALRSQFAKVRTFVFVDGVDEVTELLRKSSNIIEVTSKINADGMGVWLDGRSDYGHALESFWDQWGEQVRRRTSVIVLGDARTNYHDPAEHVLKTVSQRAGHLYWLNPEPHGAWNSGDSVLNRYQPYCDGVFEVRNLRQLRAFIEALE
jgi:uncharacterized protein with von Willebrand factor type A (vWA) domain